jgi:hypothetical protein
MTEASKVGSITYRRDRRCGTWRAYSTSPDPLPTPAGWEPSGYVGEAFRCLETRHCACGRWHGFTMTAQLPGHPQLEVCDMATRDDAVRALYAARIAWAQTLGAGE